MQCDAIRKPEPEGKIKEYGYLLSRVTIFLCFWTAFLTEQASSAVKGGFGLQAHITVLPVADGLMRFPPTPSSPHPLLPGPSPHRGSMVFQLRQSNHQYDCPRTQTSERTAFGAGGRCATKRTLASRSEREQTVPPALLAVAD